MKPTSNPPAKVPKISQATKDHANPSKLRKVVNMLSPAGSMHTLAAKKRVAHANKLQGDAASIKGTKV